MQANVRAKALHTIKSMRRERPKAEMPALRGFAGQVFTTPTGRKITAAEYCGNMDRLSRRKGEEAVQLNEDGTVRGFLSSLFHASPLNAARDAGIPRGIQPGASSSMA